MQLAELFTALLSGVFLNELWFYMLLPQNKNFTALMYACDAGREEVVRVLLSRTTKPNCLSTNKVCLM